MLDAWLYVLYHAILAGTVLARVVAEAIIPAGVLIKAASEHVPGARYVEVPTAGHSVYWELPDEFNAILDAASSPRRTRRATNA